MSSKLLKEKVKSRMIRNAATLWGAGDTDVTASFDPLVELLIEGCANEIEKIGGEIENTHARVTSRIAQLLTPDVATGYSPAHAILYARPTEDNSSVRPEDQFYFSKKIPSEINSKQEVNKDVYFSPVTSVKLINGHVKYGCFHDRINEVIVYQKKIIAETELNKQIDHATLWLGVELNAHVKDFADLSFYFDLKNSLDKIDFLKLLPHAKWSVNDVFLNTKSGFSSASRFSATRLEDEFDLDKKREEEIISLYNHHFVSFGELDNTAFDLERCKSSYPTSLEKAFSISDLNKLTGKCVWFKIEFPSSVTAEMLTDLTCNINCFPVMNRKLNEFTFRLSQNLNIVPLNTNDYFLSAKSISSAEGFNYSTNPLTNSRNIGDGTYTLRQGGIERFDKRDVIELINYLLNLLRDESAAFTVLGNEFISTYLKQLNQTLALLEQRMDRQDNQKDASSYLLINPHREGENIFVSFWSTNGELANAIKAGNKLELSSAGDIQSNSLILMNTTGGGRGKLDDLERLNAFRSSLISRGRIVTPQDIRTFCFQELGREVEDVIVKKGFMIPDDNKSGFVQTIDVLLKMPQDKLVNDDRWTILCENLSLKMNQKSSGLTPIRVLLYNKITHANIAN